MLKVGSGIGQVDCRQHYRHRQVLYLPVDGEEERPLLGLAHQRALVAGGGFEPPTLTVQFVLSQKAIPLRDRRRLANKN